MLFLISWSINSENRVGCWNVFGNMTPADDLKDAGDNIKVVGRWHRMGGVGGVCIADCASAADLNSWMLNWSSICEISAVPVVDDATARAGLQSKPFFAKKGEEAPVASEESAPASGDAASKSDSA